MPVSDSHRSARANRLLAALPPAESKRLLADMEVVALPHKAVLQEPGDSLPYVYFPTSGAISMVGVMADGGNIEVALVGREGMLGLPVFLEVDAAVTRYVVQVTGQALRMRSDLFGARASPEGPLHRLLLRYTHLLLTQIAQSVACNSLHSVEQRCCRWLLMTHARAGADQFPLTHNLLASMLGVRRASVSEVARTLQDEGLIRCERGRVSVLDHEGLTGAACECFQVVQAACDALFG